VDLIDDEGRLFGVVNVIDALVVLLILAVLIAGVALVNPFGSTEQAERYATIDLGEQQPFVAEQISTGDVMSPPGARNATVTDVHVGPAEGSNVSVTARVRINGSLGEDGESFMYRGSGVRQGGAFTLETDEYTASGTISRLDTNGTALDTVSRQVRLDGTLSTAAAQRLQSGDTATYGGHEGATVETVYIGPGNDTMNRRATATVSVEALRQSGDLTFGDQSVQLGESLSFDFGEYGLSGTIVATGEDAAFSTESAEASVVATVSQDIATQLQAGDTYNIGPETVSTIESVRQYPGPSDDQHRLYVDLSLETIVQDGDRYFGPSQLTIGASIPFRTPEYSFSGTVAALGEPAATNTTQVALETTVSDTVADAIAIGDTFEFGGQPIASVQTMDVYPTGDDSTRRVLLGLDLQTVTRDSGAYFGTDRVTLGSTIPFQTDAYRLSGEVMGRGSYVPNGSVTTETIAVTVSNVEPDFADGIEVGMTEASMGQSTAEIVDKRTEPASIILTSESGEIFERTHPRNEDVYLTVDAAVRETPDGYQFHAQSLKEGDQITLDFRTITVRGTVTDI